MPSEINTRSVHKWTFSLWQKNVLFGVAYFLCAEAGAFLSVHGTVFVSFWLPAGLYLAVLLLNPTRNWRWLAAAAFVANVLFDYFHGAKPIVVFLFYCANTLQAITGAWLIRCFAAKFPTLATLKEFFALLFFAAVFSAMLGATIGATTLVHFGLSRSFEQSWKVWWGGNVMAILLFASFILAWFQKTENAKPLFGSWKKITEAILLSMVFVAFVWYLLTCAKGVMSPNRALAVPLLLWAGLRFGLRGATAASLFLALTISFFTTQFSIGLVPGQFAHGEYVFALQTILAMGVLVSLIPAIVIQERDHSLAELRESEERFKNLAAAAFEGICISERGRILDVNNQFLAMFGYQKRDEIIGQQIVDLVAPDWRATVVEAIQTGRETIYGHQLLRKDGSVFFAEAQAKMIHIGHRTLRMTALRDVTERKRAEQALRESEEKFSKAFRTSPDVMSITDFETGCYLEVNDAHENIFGFKREEVVGRSPIELGIFENPAAREKMLEKLKEQNSLRNVEIEARTRDGKKLTLLHSAELIEIGGRLCVLRVSQDITDQKKAEQALRTSEALFRSYFELAVVGCAISSLEKGIITVNDQFCQMLGYSRQELMKMTWVQLTHPDDVAADVAQFNRVLAGEIDSYTLDKRYLHKDGREIFATISIRCVRHPDGSPNYFVGLAMDITDRHKAILREQQARIEYTLQLIAAQETERARIGAELHDSIGQNLLLVKNRLQLALTRKGLPADLREQLDDIGKLALQAIAEVRQISRDLHPYQIEHLGLTRALAAIIDNAAEASGIKFEKKLESADDVFSRDAATHIYRIVQECLNNILKHSQAKRSRIRLERDVHEVQLTIDDNGCGFEPDKTKNGRNGLGLKNIAARVRMLGGKLEVDSAPGKGTRIKVTLPIIAEAG